MNKIFIFMLSIIPVCQSAYAQSSITLYGVVDDSLTYVNNVAGGKFVGMQSQKQWPNYFGLTGAEDLGAGLRAVFKIEEGLNLNTGSSYARTSMVGLSSNEFGTLTLGRQIDLYANVTQLTSTFYANAIDGLHPGDYDRLAVVFLNNAVKYASPTIDGFRLDGLYSFGSADSGTTNGGRAFEVAANYKNSIVSASTVYGSINGIAVTPYNDIGVPELFGHSLSASTTFNLTHSDIFTAGAAVTLEAWRLSAVYSNTRMKAGGVTERLSSYDAGVGWLPRPDLKFGIGYVYSSLDGYHWNSGNAAANYSLSKRTTLYLDGSLIKASGPNVRAALTSMTPSSTDLQALVRVGIEHSF
ncbi:gram-negative porin family protein [Paraburkholderia xenovorans LB400]|uniref:Outer membrane porin, OmpC family n=1 Tax=Paraburkholderia xenovorans (strain LB400) TaxID=266265 RepID=Q13GK4_PARXL|nr:porin [Paraburkholderia xenovorans]ABE36785.1 outer membrane porin, OmpC family [Paraburkholderia xenovorans LB400]AIP35022.1 gram-negative porin family protein [Paraburkholderia xenovorans LB400]